MENVTQVYYNSSVELVWYFPASEVTTFYFVIKRLPLASLALITLINKANFASGNSPCIR